MIRGCCLLLLLGNLCRTARSDVVLDQGSQDLAAREGEEVTFPCSMKGGDMSSYYMYWYRKGQSGSLTWIYKEGGLYGADFQGRFEGTDDSSNNRFPLRIRTAELRDQAVYLCAAQLQWGVWETRALTFGTGTQLSVEPKNQATSPPSVFVVKSRAPKNDKVAAACLAKGFYPKEVTINMNPGTEVVYDSKEGVLSPDGKYSAVQVVKVGPEEAVKCTVTHASQNFSAEDSPSAPAAPTHLPAASPGFCESSTSSSTAEEPDLEKVNMLSLTVLGLRVLMAKSIAFNVLMTAKLFI